MVHVAILGFGTVGSGVAEVLTTNGGLIDQRVDEVADELGVSRPYAYKLIRQLNEELKGKGFITIAGRVNRQYFNERLYGARKEVNENASI